MGLKLGKALGTHVTLFTRSPARSRTQTVPMIMGRKSVAGSLIGGIAEPHEMPDFRGEHGTTADVEVIDMATINEAYDRMLESDVK